LQEHCLCLFFNAAVRGLQKDIESVEGEFVWDTLVVVPMRRDFFALTITTIKNKLPTTI